MAANKVGVDDFVGGMDEALFHKSYDWKPEYTLILLILGLMILVGFLATPLFKRYRFFMKSRRKELNKQRFLARLVCERHEISTGEREVLKRLIRYNELSDPGAKEIAPADQLLKFSKNLIRLMHELEYDRSGRLVIPGIEAYLSKRPDHHPDAHPVHSPARGAWRGLQSIGTNMSKSARVAMSLIKFKSNP